MSYNNKKMCNYIKKYFTPEGFTDNPPTDIKGIAKYILMVFRREKPVHEYIGIHNVIDASEQDLFVEWAQGLPSILDCGYYYDRNPVKDYEFVCDAPHLSIPKSTAAWALSCLIYDYLIQFDNLA